MASLVNYFTNFAAVSLFLCHRFASVNALPACPFYAILLLDLEDCLRSYWFIGYKNASIIMCLSLYHGVQITGRQLKYLINVKYNIRRRSRESATHEIRRAVRYELNAPQVPQAQDEKAQRTGRSPIAECFSNFLRPELPCDHSEG